MHEYIRVRTHHRLLERQRRSMEKEFQRRREQSREEARKRELTVYTRGVEHAWADAMVEVRKVIGQERAMEMMVQSQKKRRVLAAGKRKNP